MLLLAEFLLRLTFGLALAMALVPPRLVSSGYFRNHLYVTLGLSLLAALVCTTSGNAAVQNATGHAAAAAFLSYVGSVFWLYERSAAGRITLLLIAGTSFVGALFANQSAAVNAASRALSLLQLATSGLVLGVTMAAMLLGHWYLNAPGMKLAPLRKLLAAMAVAVVVHSAVCAIGLGFELAHRTFSTQDWLFIVLRWSFGLVGVLILICLAWQTLDVPNTQSATGILYVAVMGVFVGETMSLLLSAESVYPV